MEPETYPTLSTCRGFVRQAAGAALGAGALKNIVGELRLMNGVMATMPTTDYKALVCIFPSGRNDANNMVIPTIPSEYSNYVSIRTPVRAIPTASILPISPSNNDDPTYGFHPNFPHLQTLFGEAKLATVFNVGNLAYPFSRAQYAANTWRWNNELTGIYKTTVQPSRHGGFPNTTLGLPVKVIARLIAGRAALGMRRQIFFRSVGGYDTHTKQTDFGSANAISM